MPTPVLQRREDIWNNFPVIANPMGRGANGADRHCVEWHNTKVRTMARDQGKTEAQMKAEVLAQMLRALAASSAWTVEAPAPGSKCVAVIAMKFKPRNRNTRKNGKGAVKNVGTRRWNRSASPKPAAAAKGNRKATPNKTNKPNTTRKAKNHSDLSGEAMLRKAKAILNIMSKDTVERLSIEFATLTPKTVGEFEDLIKVITEIAMDQQAYHPLIIHLLHVLDARHARSPYPEKPSISVTERVLARAFDEPIFAKMEVAAEAENASPNKNIEEKVNLQRRFFRSVMLLTGFLYREDLMPWTSYKRLLIHLASMALETDPAELDYRVFDGYAQGLILTLIRGGARMQGEAAALFASLAAGLRRLSVEAKRGAIRSQAAEFLKSAEEGFKIYEGLPWSVGAPLTDLKVRQAVLPAAPAGLGADIAELWRRFPLDVKQEGPVYVVRFHGKKLRERFEKDGKYQTVADLEATLARHILQLVDASAHWKRGPVYPGTLVTVVKK